MYAQAPSAVTPPGLPSSFSIATPPHAQQLAGPEGTVSRNPLVDQTSQRDPWSDYLSSRGSL
eukprot:4381575-Amphidinium_carterae.1